MIGIICIINSNNLLYLYETKQQSSLTGTSILRAVTGSYAYLLFTVSIIKREGRGKEGELYFSEVRLIPDLYTFVEGGLLIRKPAWAGS